MSPINRLILFSAAGLLLFGVGSLAWRDVTAGAQTRPLTYPQIITALNTTLPNDAFKTKQQLIAFLISDVKRRKVDKPLTPDREDDLRQAGATDELIDVIRANSPSAQPTPTPVQTPTPRLTPTPRRSPTPSPTPPPKSKQIRNAIGMEFVLIPAGSFVMGSPESERDRRPDEGPQHRVNINYDFYLGKYEVTQAQWARVMGGPHQGMKGLSSEFFGDNYPVVRLGWNDAKAFVERLSSIDVKFTYRLPSESEWEYAARGGTTDRFYWGDDPDFYSLCKYANVKDHSACSDGYRKSAPVGTFAPNPFGLYDMTGNVWEWCEDIWQPNGYYDAPTDGSPNLTLGDPTRRTQRGGSWADLPKDARIAVRGFDLPTDRNDEDGFRIIAIPK
jgi:formylglycine-generating enzyme required for sulfatase activity